ncbi:AAA family ATPase [Methylocystis sp. SC2]|uniref:AAA family ATPase n=1 Tax=Methylocystis sp. (strain SC2) TaxID=187303 RepID=UPI00027AF4E6|nr:AAA family ATPase [Methylocystis sp. SC2]CCJ07879.1 Putative ATP-dependent OLD family endonuclease [Methylocystis sp. SC2]
MRLTGFQVKNFRSVVDSGWIETDGVTALVGVNESGKTNLLLPLWKLNPAQEGELKPTSDYPKANYGAVRANPSEFQFITAEFDCSELASDLAKMSGAPKEALDIVRVSRNFDEEYSISFPKHQQVRSRKASDIRSLIEGAISEIEGMQPLAKEAATKPELLKALATLNAEIIVDEIGAAEIAELLSILKKSNPSSPASTSTIVPRYARLAEELAEIAEKINAPAPSDVEGVLDYVIERIPRFVYYSNYGNLDSEIYLPHVVDNLKRTDLGAREAAKARTLRVLFSFVRLKPQEILELGRDFSDAQGRQPTPAEIEAIAEKKRERTILLNSAGTDLTKRFKDWWKQGDYTFEFQADGNHFRIWVSDARRPEKVELEDRSTGLQWFLSFYLVFLVESRKDHENAILLLDEPGLSLHPLAQRDLSAFFENLSATNQILYTTHSPFLVDADMLDRARKVFVAGDGSTKASADLRRGNEDPRKSGATYAIYSALNMNVAESILYGCHPVIVEGPSDQHYLATIKMLLIRTKKISPKREIVFPPSHGARNAKVVASILSGRDEVLPFMLLDGDEAGKKMATDLQNGFYQKAKDHIMLTDSFVGFEDSEIEDLFPPEFLADVIDRWERRSDTPFADVVEKGKPIVPQIEAWAASQGITLQEGWKVDVAREVKKRALAVGLDKFSGVLDNWKKLFEKLLASDGS